MADPALHPDMFVTNTSGGDVVGIGFRKAAAGVDTEALRRLAEDLGVRLFPRDGDMVREAADALDTLLTEVRALRKKLKTARATLAEDDPQAALDVGP